MIKLSLSGADELHRTLQEMAKKLGKEKTTAILAEAAKIVTRAVRIFAPKGPTGNLRRAAYDKGLPVKAWYPAVAIAAMRGRKAPHAHLVEYGTRPRYTKLGKSTGIMPSTPYFSGAWGAVKGQVESHIESRLSEELDEAMK